MNLFWSFVANDSSFNPPPSRYLPPEIPPKLKHTHEGTVSMAVAPALEKTTKVVVDVNS